ncbi:MAG: ImmA/IrrE family metallo-endopeptidase [Clostridia bacterium]|nr:ImmA/IrrE family metallo-endopeptidase [Clostridia bacterium]
MNIDRLRQIIKYSQANSSEMEVKVRDFYSFVGMSSHRDVLNIMQIARDSFRKQGYIVIEMPLSDDEIGALCYRGDAWGYILLNTSLPKVNVNFAICHEIYHVFCQRSQFRTRVEFANRHYYESEEEAAANLFAGMLLMPEYGFRTMYDKFRQESEGDERDTILRLMNYYEAPYMAVLIRCYELGLLDGHNVSQGLLSVDQDSIRERFRELWLDVGILDATKRDDFVHVEDVVTRIGQEGIGGDYLNERTLKRVLHNMRELYSDIKGE